MSLSVEKFTAYKMYSLLHRKIIHITSQFKVEQSERYNNTNSKRSRFVTSSGNINKSVWLLLWERITVNIKPLGII